jgi:hypothetical protein
VSDNSFLFWSIKKKTQAKKNKGTDNNSAIDSNQIMPVVIFQAIFSLYYKKVIGAAWMLLTIFRKAGLWLQPPYLTYFVNIK